MIGVETFRLECLRIASEEARGGLLPYDQIFIRAEQLLGWVMWKPPPEPEPDYPRLNPVGE